jgi:hypothetical protein
MLRRYYKEDNRNSRSIPDILPRDITKPYEDFMRGPERTRRISPEDLEKLKKRKDIINLSDLYREN